MALTSASNAMLGNFGYLGLGSGLEQHVHFQAAIGAKTVKFLNMKSLQSQMKNVQVRSEQTRTLNVQTTTFRREALMGIGASFLAITLLYVDSAEARTVKPEMRKKIFEKLDDLREKAGLKRQKKGLNSSPENELTQATPQEKAKKGQSESIVVEVGFSS
eukprot:Gb_27997 [translate_table: standard]